MVIVSCLLTLQSCHRNPGTETSWHEELWEWSSSQEWVERRVISPWVGHVSILSIPWRTGERRLLPGTGLAFLPEAALMFILFILIGPLVFFCIINKQMTICLQHNTLMPYHMMLHVSVCSNHHQAFLVTIIKKKRHGCIWACNYPVSEVSLNLAVY